MTLLAFLVLFAQDARDGRAVTGEFALLEGRTLVLRLAKEGAPAGKIAAPLAEDAAVLVNGAKAALSDLKPGAQVRIWVQGGQVRRIETPPPRRRPRAPRVRPWRARSCA